jgi:predicted porin
MKKSLLALAVLGAFAGAASAQSSVTLFGVVDESVNRIKNGDTTTTTMQSNMLNSNRLGFRGIEDLGGGLKAGFWLEAGMANESGVLGGSNNLGGTAYGSTGANGASVFNRRSTVSLISDKLGEVRVGRDYDPSFWNTVYDDVDGANGIGEGLNLISSLGSGAITIARDNNSVGYFLPSNLGGLYGQAMGALGEGVNGQKYWGARLGFAAGPFDVNAAYGDTKTNQTVPSNSDFKMWNVGGSWDFGVVKIFGFYNRNTWNALSQGAYELSLSVPMGQGEFRASYGHQSISGLPEDDSSRMYSVEYVYNLSKRTALYATAAKIDNSGVGTFVVAAAPSSNMAGNTSTGYNIGIRHSF